jgi:hypothetical protein
VLRVQVVRADLLEADNRAEVAVAAPRRLKIAAVGPLDQFTRFVVQSLPSERTQQLSAEDFAKLGPRSDEFDVVVAAPGALPRPIPPGRYLVLGVPAGIEGLNPYGTKDGLSVRSQRGEHPVLRAVNLDDLRVAKAVAMAPATDIEPIVEGADVPLVLVARRGPVTAVLTAFEPLDTNWPWQRAFPTFIANAVEWLGGIDQAAVGEEHRPGDTLSVRVAAGTKDATVVTPDGGRQVLPAREGSVTFGPVTRAGAYSFTWSDERGEQRRDFAVVPAMGEGRIAAAPELSVGTQTVAGTAGGAGTLSDLWPYALAAALVLLVVEWWAYHRRHWIRAAPGARAVRPIGSREPLGGGAPIMRP